MLRRPFPMSEVASLSGNSPVRGTSIHTGITREPRQGGRQLPSFFLGRNPMYSLTEDTLLSYLKSPEDYIKTTAEQYMRDNQEEFLAQFLKKDALLAEYQMLSQDSDAPVYRMRAITDALQKSGAKTVNVTVQKNGVELTFKTSAESLKGLKSQYSTWYIAPSDRLQFRHLFGAGSDYSAEDIIRIAYGRSTLYEAPSAPAEDIEMQGMSL